jgi:hypothetical protein
MALAGHLSGLVQGAGVISARRPGRHKGLHIVKPESRKADAGLEQL